MTVWFCLINMDSKDNIWDLTTEGTEGLQWLLITEGIEMFKFDVFSLHGLCDSLSVPSVVKKTFLYLIYKPIQLWKSIQDL